ncbi:23S rRNA (uridine(2552)-2'-O-)-methyltransferase [Edhazardia aedis USNM 41457]|uniref:23S rRNA (Uridine(2552)-2'-O-)-methyltransferase n=1 Tax=Edhazardia aedis (strain USNM 41457) TaxID=1003232 RepID=J9D1C5_EDHAE|nr:23S rRNA (uridine(2552)-2'-O-)-methyltransferase [Edhazardia aedis USNM 41457]|eukprot:EJW01631.1 23S rRNA (uridine(2552)-2'-O-)-methyltransferase [Edhazardia aedis USNM 41457]
MGSNSKDKRDIYYRMAKKEGYRARSAYKLIQIDQEYDLFNGVNSVVDLCSAPGSWSQVCAQKINKNGKVISIDMQKIQPLDGVHFLREDITTEECKEKIFEIVKDKIDLILFDGAPDVTGIIDIDEYHQTVLLKEALAITAKIAKVGATFVGKCFRSEDTGYIIKHFKNFFKTVKLLKPKTSRNSSHECFLLCQDFFVSNVDPRFMDVDCEPEPNIIIDCGFGPNSDLSTLYYNTSEIPVFKPLDPPYEAVIKQRRAESNEKRK